MARVLGPYGSTADAEQLQETSLQFLPAEDGPLPRWTVPELDEESTHRSVLMVLVHDADSEARL